MKISAHTSLEFEMGKHAVMNTKTRHIDIAVDEHVSPEMVVFGQNTVFVYFGFINKDFVFLDIIAEFSQLFYETGVTQFTVVVQYNHPAFFENCS